MGTLMDETPKYKTAYAKLLNPKWVDYRPELPAGTPEHDAALLDFLEQALVQGKISMERSFLSHDYNWQIVYKCEDPKMYRSGGGSSVRAALANLITDMMEKKLGT